MSMKNGLTTSLIAALVGMAFAWQAQAAGIRTWDGGGANNNWNTPANWDGDATAPGAGDTLAFGGSARLTNTNNLTAETSFAGLTFNSGAGTFVITGAVITLGGNVTNLDDSTQTINLPMILDATRTFHTASSGNLAVGSLLSGNGGLTKTGEKTLTLSGANTYKGALTIEDGTIEVATLNNVNTAGVLGSNDTTIVLGSVGKTGTLYMTGGSSQSTSRKFLLAAGGTGGLKANANSSVLTVTGVIEGWGDLFLATTANANGTVTLNANNTFSGNVTMAGPGVANLYGSGNSFINNITVNGGFLALRGSAGNNFRGTATIASGAKLQNYTAGTLANPIVNNGTFSTEESNYSVTIASLLSGSGSVIFSCNAGQTVTIPRGDNLYTGKTTLGGNAGQITLNIVNLANLGMASSFGAPATVPNGTIDIRYALLNYTGVAAESDRLFNLFGAGDVYLRQSGTGLLKLTGGIAASGAQAHTLILDGSTAGVGEIAGPLLENSAANKTTLIKDGSGLWVLSGDNTSNLYYSGTTTIKNGTLRATDFAGGSLSTNNLSLTPGNVQTAVFESSVDLIRAGGTGQTQMQIAATSTPSGAGFSAKGGPINVAFGSLDSPTALTWGVAPFSPLTGALVLNSAFADSKLTFLNPINLNNGITPNRTIQVSANVAEMSGALTASSPTNANLTKTGSGTLILSGNNVLSNITVSAGSLTMTGTNTFRDATVSVGALNLSGSNTFGSVTLSAGTALSLDGANTFSNLTSSGSATLAGTNRFNNISISAGTLTLTESNMFNNVTLGGGTLLLAGSEAPEGTVTLSGGTLVLDYTAENNDKLDPTKGLTFAPGNFGTMALRVIGHESVPFGQAVNGLTLTRGSLASINIASGRASLNLGAITRSASVNMASSPGTVCAAPVLVVENTGPGTTISSTSGVAVSLLLSAAGSAFATYNGDWAAKDAGNANLVAGASVGGFYTADAWSAGNNTDVTGSSSPAPGSTTASLRFNAAAARTVTLSGANTITSGGILVTTNVGANLSRISGGTLAAGSSGKELVVIQNNTNGALQIDSQITGSGYMLTKAGAGSLILTAQNPFTGGYFINQGTLQFGTEAFAGTVDQTAGGARCGDIVATGDTTLRVVAGSGGLTQVVYRLTLGGVNGMVMTIDAGSNAVLRFKNGLGAINAGGTYPYWVKVGGGTLENGGTTYGVPGWIKEGRFIAEANSFNGVGPQSGNLGSTIGDSVAGAPDARVELAGNITNFDPSNNGSDILILKRTGTLDLKDKTLGSANTMDNMRFVGGGAITSSSGTPGSFTRFWSTITYLADNAYDEAASISRVPVTMQANATFAINDSAFTETELLVSSDLSGSVGLTKNGSGVMSLSGTNTYSGTTTVSAGTLIAGKPASLPNYNANSKIVVSAGTLAVNAGGAGEWTATEIDALRGTTPSPFAASAWFGIDTTGGNFTYDSIIGNGVGALGLRKLGTNLLVLTAANAYTGGTTIEKGTLVASNANALGTSGTITVNSNAAFAVASGITFSRPVTFNPGSILSGQGTFNANGSWNCPAGLILAPGLPTGTLTVDVGGQTLALADNTLRIAFPAEATSKLLVNGTLNIGSTAKLVLSGKPPFKKTVLAEGTARVGQFQEANVDLSGLERAGVIQYTATQVVLYVPSPGTLLIIR